MFCLADLEAHAGDVLDKNAWGYYSFGVDRKQTLRDNEEAFKRYHLRPRMLRDVSKVDTATQLFGNEIAFPICVSPTSLQCLAHPDGEAATAKACSKMNTCMVLSVLSTTSIEKVAESSGSGLRWIQLYSFKDKELTRELLLRAESAGYKALVITVDQPVVGNAGRHLTFPKHLSLANLVQSANKEKEYVSAMFDPSNTWETVDWFQSITKLPIIIKGILTSEDAQEAMKHKVKGIIVSNHGGRQLDGVPTTIDALPEIVEAVKGRAEVFLDGGVREGTDVLKALALGAKAVFIGRPALWGLAYKGSEGVELVLKLLKDEFRLAMMLSGCTKLSDINPELVTHKSCINPPTSRL